MFPPLSNQKDLSKQNKNTENPLEDTFDSS